MARRAMDNLAAAGLRAVQDQRRRHPPQRRPARRVQGARRLVRRAAARHPAAAQRARRRHVARPAPDQRPAAPDLRLAAGQRRDGAHRRLVLPPQRARRAAARAEHVRRRPGGVPDRPDRRRLRLPVRDPRPVQGRVGARRRRVRRGVEAQRRCSSSCASRSRPGRARAAAATTRARAVAWPPSSSPACRSTAPTPSASAATATSPSVPSAVELDAAPVARPLASSRDQLGEPCRCRDAAERRSQRQTSHCRKVGGSPPHSRSFRWHTCSARFPVPSWSLDRVGSTSWRRARAIQAPPTSRVSSERRWGAVVFLLDAIKGALPALVGVALDTRPGAYVLVSAAVLGHMFPATAGSTAARVSPPWAVPCRRCIH